MLSIEKKGLMKPSFLKIAFGPILWIILVSIPGIVCNISFRFEPPFLFDWLPEIILLIAAFIYILLGFVLNVKKFNVVRYFKYRLYGSFIMALVLFDVGLRNALIGREQSMMVIYILSISISTWMMFGVPKKTMKKMETARLKGWLNKKLDEKDWIWDIVAFVDYDGPVLERDRLRRLKITDKLHYVMPAIGSVLADILGTTNAFNLVGLILISLGIAFISAIAQNIGEIRQLELWEILEGKELGYVK